MRRPSGGEYRSVPKTTRCAPKRLAKISMKSKLYERLVSNNRFGCDSAMSLTSFVPSNVLNESSTNMVVSGNARAIVAVFQMASSADSVMAWRIGLSPSSTMRSTYLRIHGLSMDAPWNRVWKLIAASPSSFLQRSSSASDSAP